MTLADLNRRATTSWRTTRHPRRRSARRIRAYLNRSQREILGFKGFTPLRQHTLVFSPVACSPFAVLPKAAVRLLALVDVTNQTPLMRMDAPGPPGSRSRLLVLRPSVGVPRRQLRGPRRA